MERIDVKKLFEKQVGDMQENILIAGWIRTIRMSKTVGFIEINDGSCLQNIQVVFDENLPNFAEVSKYNVGAAVAVNGFIVKTESRHQSLEIRAKEIELLGASAPEYPLQKKRHSMEYLRSIAHLRPRTNTFSAVFRLRSLLAYAIHRFFQERGFIYVQTPLITGSDAEGAGELFRVTVLDEKDPPIDSFGKPDHSKDFFGKKTHLTVSGQLEGEAYCMAFGRIYTFGPTFRAENSNTARHAAEFWMVEPEIAFAGIEENMQLAEDMLKYLISYAMENAAPEMEFFGRYIDEGLFERLRRVSQAEFGRITYSQAIEMLKAAKKQFNFPVRWGCDLQTEHERYLTEEIFGRPVFVVDYPKEIKAFYMRLNDDQKTVAAMDLLVPGVGEIIGGSQREERLSVLEERIRQSGLSPEDYWWYLDLRKYGGTKHSGFGLGFERLLMYLSGMSNIRDVIPFPRTVRNAEF